MIFHWFVPIFLLLFAGVVILWFLLRPTQAAHLCRMMERLDEKGLKLMSVSVVKGFFRLSLMLGWLDDYVIAGLFRLSGWVVKRHLAKWMDRVDDGRIRTVVWTGVGGMVVLGMVFIFS